LTALTVFELAHPGCQALFLFDNATSHCAYAEDELKASRMNKEWGGGQPHMRDGYYYKPSGTKVIQKMSFAHNSEVPKQM
jgi:hypothetical protein